MGFSCLILPSSDSCPGESCFVQSGQAWVQILISKGLLSKNGWFCFTRNVWRWKSWSLLSREGFCNSSFRAWVWGAVMQSLAQNLAEKTLARSDVLDLLAVRAQLAAGGATLPGWGEGARAAAPGDTDRCHCLSALLPGVCACAEPGRTVPPQPWCFSPCLGTCGACSTWGGGRCTFSGDHPVSLLPSHRLNCRVWWEALGALNMISVHFYVSENVILKSSYFWSLQGWTGMLRPFRELLVLSAVPIRCHSNQHFFCIEEWSVLQD